MRQPITELDGIRLLILHPALRADRMRCSIVHTTLSRCNHEIIDYYTALSYVWGGETYRRVVSIDGLQIEITANLYFQLRDLRDEERPL